MTRIIYDNPFRRLTENTPNHQSKYAEDFYMWFDRIGRFLAGEYSPKDKAFQLGLLHYLLIAPALLGKICMAFLKFDTAILELPYGSAFNLLCNFFLTPFRFIVWLLQAVTWVTVFSANFAIQTAVCLLLAPIVGLLLLPLHLHFLKQGKPARDTALNAFVFPININRDDLTLENCLNPTFLQSNESTTLREHLNKGARTRKYSFWSGSDYPSISKYKYTLSFKPTLNGNHYLIVSFFAEYRNTPPIAAIPICASNAAAIEAIYQLRNTDISSVPPVVLDDKTFTLRDYLDDCLTSEVQNILNTDHLPIVDLTNIVMEYYNPLFSPAKKPLAAESKQLLSPSLKQPL